VYGQWSAMFRLCCQPPIKINANHRDNILTASPKARRNSYSNFASGQESLTRNRAAKLGTLR